jgi:hypothetical protein
MRPKRKCLLGISGDARDLKLERVCQILPEDAAVQLLISSYGQGTKRLTPSDMNEDVLKNVDADHLVSNTSN